MVSHTSPGPLADVRREYGHLSLDEKETPASPFLQFEHWITDARAHEQDDPTAMVLSTVDADGCPDSRVVLLKGLELDRFIFYTNYTSTKALEMHTTPHVALNFYWPKMARQVRIRGQVKRVSTAQSDTYFASRPRLSQLSAMASAQSQPLESRANLEQRIDELSRHYEQQAIPRPEYWGGYAVTANEIEFWQGRDNRVHDRICYRREGDAWVKVRLAP